MYTVNGSSLYVLLAVPATVGGLKPGSRSHTHTDTQQAHICSQTHGNNLKPPRLGFKPSVFWTLPKTRFLQHIRVKTIQQHPWFPVMCKSHSPVFDDRHLLLPVFGSSLAATWPSSDTAPAPLSQMLPSSSVPWKVQTKKCRGRPGSGAGSA